MKPCQSIIFVEASKRAEAPVGTASRRRTSRFVKDSGVVVKIFGSCPQMATAQNKKRAAATSCDPFRITEMLSTVILRPRRIHRAAESRYSESELDCRAHTTGSALFPSRLCNCRFLYDLCAPKFPADDAPARRCA